MSPKAKDEVATLTAYDGDREPVVLTTTKKELDRMFRDSLIQGALASAAIEEGGAVDCEVLTVLLDENAKKHG